MAVFQEQVSSFERLLGATFDGVWNKFDSLSTSKGVFWAVYHPGSGGEIIEVLLPDGNRKTFNTPSNNHWELDVQDEKLAIRWFRSVSGGYDPETIVTDIDAGVKVEQLITGGTGPIGPRGPDGLPGEPGEPGVTTTKVVTETKIVATDDASRKLGPYLTPDDSVNVYEHLRSVEYKADRTLDQLAQVISRESTTWQGIAQLRGDIAKLTFAIEALQPTQPTEPTPPVDLTEVTNKLDQLIEQSKSTQAALTAFTKLISDAMTNIAVGLNVAKLPSEQE
jgi:hypothetical protein